jgi:hypothetical protein
MRTFLRFLVAIPLLIVGISAMVMSVMAFDNPWLSILAVGLWSVFIFLMYIYEDLVYSFGYYIKDKILEIV